MIKRIIRRILRPSMKAYYDWVDARGDTTLFLDHPLHKNSLVFEIGGYKGKTTKLFYDKFRCTIYVFEPVKEFCNEMKRNFNGIPNIKIFDYGLGGKTEELKVGKDLDNTTVFSQGNETITIKDIVHFLDEHNIPNIDLMNINIEGGEYLLLKRLITTKKINHIKTLQIQFHKNVIHHKIEREQIRRSLSKTHRLVYDFPFLWECWTLK